MNSHDGTSKHLQSGLSLIELMIAMLIGLLIALAAGGMFMSNKRIYGTIETMSRIQENARVAFEMMSRDLREAGGNPCAANGILVNQLSTANGTGYWADFAQGVTGYEAGGPPGVTTVVDSDALEIHGGRAIGARVTAHATPDAAVAVSSVAGITGGDIMMVCNPDFAFVFQVTNTAGGVLAHTGGLNCDAQFRDERPGAACMGATQRSYCFGSGSSADCNAGNVSPAEVARVVSTRWYVANNARNGRSLFREELVNVTGADAASGTRLTPVEVVEGVEDMQIQWLSANDANYADAAGTTDWSNVIAARITLQLQGTEGALSAREIQGTDGQALARTVTHVVTLRNREELL